jgi:hypothetical protein
MASLTRFVGVGELAITSPASKPRHEAPATNAADRWRDDIKPSRAFVAAVTKPVNFASANNPVQRR